MTDFYEATLADIGSVSRGRSRHRPRDDRRLYGGPYPFIQTGDVKAAGLYIAQHTQTYNEYGLAQSKLWPAGTLLITIAANIAESAILTYPACFPDSIVGFISDENKVRTKYIKYYLDYLKIQIQQVSKGTTQDNLSVDKLLSFKFKIPSIEYQDKVVTKLATLDDLIHVNERKIKVLEEMARRIYREWFVDFKFPGHEKVKMVDSRHPDFGMFPEGWRVKEVSDFGEVKTGRTPSKKRPEFYGHNYLFVKTPDMHGRIFVNKTSEMLSTEGHLNQGNKVIPKNAIMVSCIGTLGTTGISSVESSTNQQINTICPSNPKTREYLFLWANTLAEKLSALGSSGATMGNVNKSKFESIELLEPSEKVTNDFNALVSPMFDLISLAELENESSRNLRDLLLPKLISGEIDVSNITVEGNVDEVTKATLKSTKEGAQEVQTRSNH